MSADLLRRAATKLREHAQAASPGPWTATVHGHYTSIDSISPDGHMVAEVDECTAHARRQVPDGEYLALMHPPVALAIASLLDDHAEITDALRGDVDAPEFCHWPIVALARTILREATDAG